MDRLAAVDLPLLDPRVYLLVGLGTVAAFVLAFPFEVSFLSDVFIEGAYLLLVVVLAVLVRRLRVDVLEAGWMLFTYARLVDFLDEVVAEPNPLVNPYLGGALTIAGLTLTVVGMYAVTQERAERIEILEERRDQLAVMNRLLRHDIRNDMALAEGLLETVRQDAPARLHDRLDRVAEASRHVIDLTESVRGVTGALRADAPVDAEPIDLGELLAVELDRARGVHPSATIDAPEELPSLPVPADEVVASVFRNLLNNAVEHSDRAEPHVTVDVLRRGGRASVTVADDGPGIPDAKKEAVFTRGERAPDSGGLGIGLYIVKVLTEAYGGEISVADNDPRGTVFTVSFPLAE